MKRIVNPAPPLAMTTKRTPLIVLLTIGIVDDGTLTQTQDAARGLWRPNRDISMGGTDPLILYPVLEVHDPDLDTKVTVNPTINWYIDDINPVWNPTTEKGMVEVFAGGNTQKFFLQTADGQPSGTPTGRLVVRKNVDYLAAKRVVLEMSFTDNTRNETYTRKAEVLLSSENRPEDFYTVRLNQPNTIHFNPLAGGSSLRTFQATARRGQEDVSASCKFFWTIDGVAIATDGSMPCYQAANQPSGKGQGKDTIVLDLDCLDGVQVGVAVGDSVDAAAPLGYASASSNVIWDWPELELTPHALGARHMKEKDTQKTFHGIVQADGVDVPAAVRSEYIMLNWWIRPADTGVKSFIGWGDEMIIPASSLRKTGGVNVDVSADICVLGPMEVLYDDTLPSSDPGYMQPLTDDSASTTASDFGGLVVGRN